MSYILGMGMCKCLTRLEKYHIQGSLNNEINKTEKDIRKEKKESNKLRMKKTKKELQTIKNRVENTPDCSERYGE